MTSLHAAAYLTLFAPLAGCVLIALLGMRLPARLSGWLGSAAILAGFAGALWALLAWHGGSHAHGELVTPYTWLTAGDFSAGFDLYVDPLSIFEMLVVTGVGFLIHVYSIGYMAGDPQERRFFAYMNVFVFAMLMLVMAGNFVFLLVGWGLVGMASYLLIGFWHERPSAVAAAKKAFVMNAVGDVGIMLGLFLLFVHTHALTYPAVFDKLAHGAIGTDTSTALLACLLLLAGAVAKSAQLPLHTWLPDAMEGPTPVSALIHAATMVTAGVYLVARMHPVFDLSYAAQVTVAVIGALTLFVAGFLALVQVDIKRVIAYSTMSQIGYMFVAVGLGAYSAGMFHLMTHAFFKALLFLAAGVVIHALGGEQDIRAMGGLRTLMPKTYALFLVASLALAGIIPLSGFWSKDEILANAFASHHVYGGWGWFVYALGLSGVLLTGIYTFRLFYVVFHGPQGTASQALANAAAAPAHVTPAPAGAHDPHAAHAHHGEGPASMLWPIAVLGVLSAVGGLVTIPGAWHVVETFLDQAGAAPAREALRTAFDTLGTGGVWALSMLSLLVALAGIGIATMVWKTGAWAPLRARSAWAQPALVAGLGFDAFYDAVFFRSATATARLARTIENDFVGPVVEEVATTVRRAATGVSRLQSGLVRTYALGTALAGAVAVVWFVVAQR